MNSKRIVEEVFTKGYSSRIPIQIEANSLEEEYALSDTLGISVRVSAWQKYIIEGGPLRRLENERILDWIDRVEKYWEDIVDWPNIDDVVQDCLNQFLRKFQEKFRSRFIIAKILGPTEICESFFITKPIVNTDLEHFSHKFEYALLLKIRKDLAYRIYDKVSRYVLEIVKSLSELEQIDALRIADDLADYRGIIYRQDFVLEVYLKWHEEFSKTIKKRGKFPILHCDGDITSIIDKLIRMYSGLHPLDITKKVTIKDYYHWIEKLKILKDEFMKANTKTVMITGLPVELIFNNDVYIDDFLHAIKHFIEILGRDYLLLSTTHRPYPERSYQEELARRKIMKLREVLK